MCSAQVYMLKAHSKSADNLCGAATSIELRSTSVSVSGACCTSGCCGEAAAKALSSASSARNASMLCSASASTLLQRAGRDFRQERLAAERNIDRFNLRRSDLAPTAVSGSNTAMVTSFGWTIRNAPKGKAVEVRLGGRTAVHSRRIRRRHRAVHAACGSEPAG